MKNETNRYYEELFLKYPALSVCKDSILKAYELIEECYRNGGKLLVCGNGGSAADSEHIVGELMKGFHLLRPLSEKQKILFENLEHGEYIASALQGGLPAISLVSHTGLMTAFNNDVDSDLVFAQQVWGYMNENDVLITLSTSGNSKNCVYAAETAKAKGGKMISVTGEGGGKLKDLADSAVLLPSRDTAEIQELTLPTYHCLCAMIEAEFFANL